MELYLTFISYKQSLPMRISSTEENVMNFYRHFIGMFPGLLESYGQSQVMNIYYDSELKGRLETFTNDLNEKIPQVNEIARFFRNLNLDDQFFIIPLSEIGVDVSIKVNNYLTSIHEGKNYEELNKQYEDLFGELMQDYRIVAYGHEQISIGHKKKEERLCRFCSNKRVPLTFRKKAHAISEGIGNKTVVLYDECDGCNEEFSKDAEQDIIEYFSFLRTFYDVKGKGGRKKIKGKNFSLSHDELAPTLSFINDKEEKRIDPEFLFDEVLSSHAKISAQNVYRSLSKYFLSVIDEKYLKGFEKTIRWINGEYFGIELPKIMKIISYSGSNVPQRQPILSTFIRKSNDRKIPYAVGELQFLFIRLVFIVPYTTEDDLDYSLEENYEIFLKKFIHYDKIPSKTFFSLSDNEKKQFQIHMRILKPEIKSE